MSHHKNIEIAYFLVDGITGNLSSAEIAKPFAESLLFEVQGDEGALPWIGKRSGRLAMIQFLDDLRMLTEPMSFDVDEILASDTRAVIVGALRTTIKRTGRILATQFAIILTISHGSIIRFQMLEDSYTVSKAARLV